MIRRSRLWLVYSRLWLNCDSSLVVCDWSVALYDSSMTGLRLVCSFSNDRLLATYCNFFENQERKSKHHNSTEDFQKLWQIFSLT